MHSTLAPETASKLSDRNIRWNHWYAASVASLALFVTYVIAVCSRAWGGAADAAPRPWNAIFLTALSLAIVLAFLLGWRHERQVADADRDARQVERDEQTAAWRASVLDAIETLQNTATTRRTDEETTVNLNRRREGRPVYASAAVYTGHADPVETYVASAMERFEHALKARLAQEYMDGKQSTLDQLGLDGANGNGKIRHLPHAR